jgi:hypothetical protein
MYSSTAQIEKLKHEKLGVAVYKTRDLENFEEPVMVMDISQLEGFWADRDVWAPEVHKYGESYYLFVTLKSEDRFRGTQIFKSQSPMGEFLPISEKPVTPEDWSSLDGTLYVEDGRPYMVFCHEWTQIKNGTMCAVELTEDLTATVGEPFLLFAASDNPWVHSISSKAYGEGYVTDGPFLFCEQGKLKMIWSSFVENTRYALFGAESDGGIRGKWTHSAPLYDFDGGHSMLFSSLEGKRMIALHAPNHSHLERANFLEF